MSGMKLIYAGVSLGIGNWQGLKTAVRSSQLRTTPLSLRQSVSQSYLTHQITQGNCQAAESSKRLPASHRPDGRVSSTRAASTYKSSPKQYKSFTLLFTCIPDCFSAMRCSRLIHLRCSLSLQHSQLLSADFLLLLCTDD